MIHPCEEYWRNIIGRPLHDHSVQDIIELVTRGVLKRCGMLAEGRSGKEGLREVQKDETISIPLHHGSLSLTLSKLQRFL
jgi:hypothetical protein